MTTLSKHELDMGLRRLGELAVARGIEINLVVIGGAARYAFLDLWEEIHGAD